MIGKFLQTINEQGLVEKGEGIVIGVSGGPDSVCLLHLFWSIREEYSLKLYAVHLNHQFRGIDAQKDADFVKELCERLDIQCFIYTENVTAYAHKKRMSDEEAGRELRYKYFYEVLHKNRAQKIAVAQNMNDQAETILMRLMRGSGIDGLRAIEYKRDDGIIRPLLEIERNEIEKYCVDHRLNPRIDKTNLEAVYTRNRIRLELIPYIEKYFNQNIKTTLCRTANLLREDSDFIEQSSRKFYDEVVQETKDTARIDIKSFVNLHISIKKRILRMVMRSVSGEQRDVESRHIKLLLDFINDGRNGSKIDLPHDMLGVLEYNEFVLKKRSKSTVEEFIYQVDVGSTLFIKEIKVSITTRLLDNLDMVDLQKKDNIKYFDFDKVKEGISIRNRRKGDSFVPFGMSGRKKLKDFFIDEKVPRDKRNEVPLICDGEEIMWIVGYRISNKYKIDSSTKKILEIKIKNK